MHRWTLFKRGMKDGIPVILGYIPIGIAYGMMAVNAHVSIPATLSLSLFVYTGAGQMAGINMMGQHATILAIVCTTFIMNLRHIILSTCVMDKLHDGKRWQRVLLSFFITDEVFALYTSKPKPIDNISYFFGLGLTCWLSWFVGSWLGAVSTNLLPPVLSSALGISLYAMFIALVIPGAKKSSRLLMVVGCTAILSTIFSQFLSSSWAMICATLLSAFIGLWVVKEEDVL